jgi:hypothetical protein
LACKEGKDGAAAISSFLPSNSCIDGIFAKAPQGVVFEIGCGGSVFRVLKTTNNSCACLAIWSSTGKDMAWAVFMILKDNIGFEKRVDRRAPSPFERL